jgi:hypothetical protein
MNYQQAVQHKKEILKSLEDLLTFRYFEIVIAPSKAEDFDKFLKEYKANPAHFTDESCLSFSTDNKYMVYRICEDNILNCREGKI